MCWSFEVSVLSYATISALTGFLWLRNHLVDRWAALLFLFVGQVQLAEAVLWLDPSCGVWNRAASLALFALVLGQPLVHCCIAWWRRDQAVPKRFLRLLTVVTAAGTVVLVVATVPRSWGQLCSPPCPLTRHLRWGWNANVQNWMRVVFCLVDCAPFLAMRPFKHAAAFAAYVSGFFAVCMYRYVAQGTMESMWCWFGVFGAVLPLLLDPVPQPRTQQSKQP